MKDPNDDERVIILGDKDNGLGFRSLGSYEPQGSWEGKFSGCFTVDFYKGFPDHDEQEVHGEYSINEDETWGWLTSRRIDNSTKTDCYNLIKEYHS